MNEIGTNIKRAREAKRWSQSELARRLGVTPQAVQKWENGGLPRGSRVNELAALLDMSVAALLSEGQEEGKQFRVTEPVSAYTVKAAQPVKSIDLESAFSGLDSLKRMKEITPEMLTLAISLTKTSIQNQLMPLGIEIAAHPEIRGAGTLPDNFTTPNTGEVDGFKWDDHGTDRMHVEPLLDEHKAQLRAINAAKKAND